MWTCQTLNELNTNWSNLWFLILFKSSKYSFIMVENKCIRFVYEASPTWSWNIYYICAPGTLHIQVSNFTLSNQSLSYLDRLVVQVKTFYFLPLTTNTSVRYILPQRHTQTLDNGMLLRFYENLMSAMVEVSLIGTLLNEVG